MKTLFRKKIVYDIFDFYAHAHPMPKVFKKSVERIELIMCKIVDEVIVCTEKRSAMLTDLTGIDPVIVYNTPNLEIMSSVPNNSRDKITDDLLIAYVGTLSMSGRLLKEIIEKIKRTNEVELHIAGLGPLEEYIKNQSENYRNIFFYGQINNQQALELQAKADLLFATYDPSIEINRNAAPNKVYEAMALGKPVVVCHNTDCDLVVNQNNIGCSIDYDADDFMSCALRYRDNFELRLEHGSNGLDAYQEKYSWQICRERIQKVFRNLSG